MIIKPLERKKYDDVPTTGQSKQHFIAHRPVTVDMSTDVNEDYEIL